MAAESHATILCKSCGLCCTGHLFIWAKLRPSELDPAERLGLTVFRSDPNQRGFNQPCPLWQGQCIVYNLPQYPRVCRAYQCKLLKELLRDETTLPAALEAVRRAMSMIHDLESLLPPSTETNFRQRLVTVLEEAEQVDAEFRQRAEVLLDFYDEVFGVDDVVEKPDY